MQNLSKLISYNSMISFFKIYEAFKEIAMLPKFFEDFLV